MSDLINGRTPEEIKKRAVWCSSSLCCGECIYDTDNCNCSSDEIIKDALALINHLEAERDAALAKVPKWISVEKRLPDTRGIYLAHVVHRYCKVDSYSRVCIEYFNADKAWDSLGDIYEITHWMPMPEPPEEEK